MLVYGYSGLYIDGKQHGEKYSLFFSYMSLYTMSVGPWCVGNHDSVCKEIATLVCVTVYACVSMCVCVFARNPFIMKLVKDPLG